jgi:hypothetical protein
VCLLTDGHAEELCGEAVIDTLRTFRAGGEYPVHYYRVTHQLHLDRLRGAFGVPATPFGTIFTDENASYYHLVLGLKEHSLMGWDGGQIYADLSGSRDSLLGVWRRSCFAECPETGRIVLRRSLPR